VNRKPDSNIRYWMFNFGALQALESALPMVILRRKIQSAPHESKSRFRDDCNETAMPTARLFPCHFNSLKEKFRH
jgi:hypothetical protein